MNIETAETFFKSSARSGGARLYKEGKVSFSKPSSLEITAYVKPNYRVNLKLDSIRSVELNADCNCPPSKKGELCKHIWASVLAVFEKSPDFFEAAKEVVKKVSIANTPRPLSEEQTQAKEIFKLKQEIYRRKQYEKQKERAQEFKNKKKKFVKEEPSFPKDVQTAINYFSQNGFTFEDSLNENTVQLARKKLSRIFHPDVGGSHSEIVELNANSEVLLKYVSKL